MERTRGFNWRQQEEEEKYKKFWEELTNCIENEKIEGVGYTGTQTAR
jgi:DNA mismatch repair protein MutH